VRTIANTNIEFTVTVSTAHPATEGRLQRFAYAGLH
jgi:hypothetical protein